MSGRPEARGCAEVTTRPCHCHLSSCSALAVAFWNCVNGNRVVLCQSCLDHWFDNTDDDPSLEPESWGWLWSPA